MERSASPKKTQTSRNQFCRPDVKFLETSYKEKIPVCYVKAQRGGACGVPFDKRTRRRLSEIFLDQIHDRNEKK